MNIITNFDLSFNQNITFSSLTEDIKNLTTNIHLELLKKLMMISLPVVTGKKHIIVMALLIVLLLLPLAYSLLNVDII